MSNDLISSYNYDEFVEEKFGPWMRFAQSPALGQPAPDHTLTTVQGETVRLSDYWTQAQYTIVEFGSVT